MIVLSLACYGGLLLITRNRLSDAARSREPICDRPRAGPARAVDSPRGST